MRALRAVWLRHGDSGLRIAALLFAVAALIYLPYKFIQLTTGGDRLDAIDLLLRHAEVRAWFAGEPIYETMRSASYPPATQLLLWPFLGWTPDTAVVRWTWAASCAAALGALVWVVVRVTGATTSRERLLAAMIPLGLYATGGTIGNGQLGIHVVLGLALLPALLSRARDDPSLHHDALLAGVFVLVLVKPNLTAPFAWLVLLVPGRLRPAILVTAGYAAATAMSAAFQGESPVSLMADWLGRIEADVAASSSVAGFGSLNDLLLRLGLPDLGAEVPVAVFALFGIWAWRHRHAPVWLLAGVAAVASRIWTYHAWYDDLILLIAMIALFRLAKGLDSPRGADPVAALILALLLAGMIAPGGHYLLPEPLRTIYAVLLIGVWIATLAFLASRVPRRPARDVTAAARDAARATPGA